RKALITQAGDQRRGPLLANHDNRVTDLRRLSSEAAIFLELPLSQLDHPRRDQYASSRGRGVQLGQHVERGGRPSRIRVESVVDDQDASGAVNRLQAVLDRL